MNKTRILVAEDEKDILDLIHFNLFKENFEVDLASDGQQALDRVEQSVPDLAVLDIMMPGLDGITLCEKLRSSEKYANLGIILLTAKGTEEDIVRGLEAGADDYITKPFSPKVLVARVNALLRRKDKKHTQATAQIKVHNMSIDVERRQFLLDSNEIELTYTEFQLLILLSSNPGVVYTRSQIVDTIRGENHAITDRSVDVQVVGLRKKLGESGQLIQTVRGVGYRLKEE